MTIQCLVSYRNNMADKATKATDNTSRDAYTERVRQLDNDLQRRRYAMRLTI